MTEELNSAARIAELEAELQGYRLAIAEQSKKVVGLEAQLTESREREGRMRADANLGKYVREKLHAIGSHFRATVTVHEVERLDAALAAEKGN